MSVKLVVHFIHHFCQLKYCCDKNYCRIRHTTLAKMQAVKLLFSLDAFLFLILLSSSSLQTGSILTDFKNATLYIGYQLLKTDLKMN